MPENSVRKNIKARFGAKLKNIILVLLSFFVNLHRYFRDLYSILVFLFPRIHGKGKGGKVMIVGIKSGKEEWGKEVGRGWHDYEISEGNRKNTRQYENKGKFPLRSVY